MFVGAFAGLVAGVAVASMGDRFGDRERTALIAHASFGLTVLSLAFLSSVNVPGADTYLGSERSLVIAFVVALAAAIAAWQRDRRATEAR